MPITTLIEDRDNSEIIRDAIAAILAAESAAQQVLATADGQDPDLWRLRVFLERANPWDEYLDATDEDLDTAPLVNVALDNYNVDLSASNVVERQKMTAVYHIDVYGFGVSTDEVTGHTPGDQASAVEVQRAVRLVRKILMSGLYTYLGLRGVVWRRMVQSVTMFQPQIDTRAVQHVSAARIAFQVEYNELSPQVEGQALELISVTVARMENGEVIDPQQLLVSAEFDHSDP